LKLTDTKHRAASVTAAAAAAGAAMVEASGIFYQGIWYGLQLPQWSGRDGSKTSKALSGSIWSMDVT